MKIKFFIILIFLILTTLKCTLSFINDTSKLDTDKCEKNSLNALMDSQLSTLGYTKHPLFKINNLFYFKGTVKDIHVLFLLDTGSTKASILSDGLNVLNLNYAQTNDKFSNMNGDIKFAKIAMLPNVTIGNINIGELSATVMEQPFKNDLPTIVIGTDFLERYNAIIDCKHLFLYLNKERISNKDQHNVSQLLGDSNYQSIPLTKLVSGHFTLLIQINNESPAYFLFDTGTSETTVSHLYVDHLKIHPSTEYVTKSATDGDIIFASINLKKIIFNPLLIFFQKPVEFKDVKACSANIAGLSTFLNVAGVMGLDNIEKLNAIINIPTQSVFFLQND